MSKILRFLAAYKWVILLAIVFVFGQAICDLTLPNLMSDIINDGVLKNNMNAIYTAGGWMLLVTAAGVVCAVIASYITSRIGSGVARDIRHRVFKTTIKYSSDQLNQIGTASLITRSTNDVQQIQQFVTMSRMMVYAPIVGIGGVIMAVSQAPSLAWVIIVVVAVVFLIILAVLKFVMPLFTAQQKKLDKLNLVMRESLTGIRVVRAFNRTEHESGKFDEANSDLANLVLKIGRAMSILMPVIMFVMSATSVLIIWVGADRINAGSVQIGDVMAFIQYVMQILMGMIMFTMLFILWPRASVSARRIGEVLGSVNEINDADDPVEVKPSHGGGLIEFKDVVFQFKGAESPVLKNISFKAEPGKTTAIIGGTGSGKSTILDLISRNYDVGSGQILLDGVDIRHIPQAELRAGIGLVPQQGLLFTGTVAENIRYGREDATDEEVERAAKIAQAYNFITRMPNGFDSELSQGGANVSGGQKQRLCIARALIRKPKIYIFDDSFSALDFKTDAKLRKDLKGETSDATVIVVAQRVSTIMDADQIIVLDDGEIAGIGTHKELYETCQVYEEIVSSQLSKEEIA